MKKTRLRFISLLAFLALFLSALGTVIAAHTQRTAFAEDYAPSTIFSAGTGGTVGASEGDTSFVEFTLTDEGAVHFRRDLALKWYVKADEEAETNGVANYFSFKFSVPEYNFETLSLKFESAQENITKDGTTTNALEFSFTDGQLQVGVKNAAYFEAEAAEEELPAYDKVDLAVADDYTVAFTQNAEQDRAGAFTVLVNGNEVGEFTNIGGYYLEYLSTASSTPRVPLTVEAKTVAKEEVKQEQILLIKELNGQSFELKEGRVVDNAAPVLVVNEKLHSFPLGQKFNLTYETIDVCDQSLTVTRQYRMENAKKEDGSADTEYKTLTTSTYFLPTENGRTEEFVSIRFKLNDGRTLEEGEEEYIYLSWYCENTKKVEDVDFIPVNRSSEAPAYIDITTEAGKTAVQDYQTAVNEASEKLNAGKGAYFYLPSLRELITDEDTDYRNLTFTVYYKNRLSTSTQSASNLSYNALRFEIDKKGEYSFRVVAKDKLGNSMQLMQDEELVTVDSNNVWDFDEIPQFDFKVSSKGATIEKPKEQSRGYLDSTYTVKDFEIIALEGYKVDYTLYFFDQQAYVAAGNIMPTYAEMVENPEKYAGEYLKEIRPYDSDIQEDDAAWDRTDNDYYWYPSSKTFRPQEAGFYFVKAEVTDTDFFNEQVVSYQVIEVSNPIDEIRGETYWLQNNIVSIVLFSISAVLAVIVVILFLVKPSEKKVEEVDLKKLKGKKTDKKN